MHTDKTYLDDAYLSTFAATVVGVDPAERRVALDRTAFYATGGGQPHDTGTLTFAVGGASVVAPVVDVRSLGDLVWHALGGDDALPAVGTDVAGALDWERRHALMRTHTAVHVMCQVIWREWGVPVTGGNMEPLKARVDFEFDPLPEGFAERLTTLVNEGLAAAHPIEVSYLPRAEALGDPDLIRTKVSLIPESVERVRVVDIVGFDKQADGGTHVRTTAEVGTFSVAKTESKGKGNKRVRVVIS